MYDTYKTLAKPSEGLFKDKGSKFLSFAFPVDSEDEIRFSELNRIEEGLKKIEGLKISYIN